MPTSLRRCLLTLVIASSVGLGVADAARAMLSCENVAELSSRFLQKHIRYRTVSQDIETRTAANMIRRLDPQRILFLQSDAAELASSLAKVLGEARAGSCDRLRPLQLELVTRHANLESEVRKMLSDDGFEIDQSAELVLDPEKRERPVTKKQQKQQLRTLVNFQISNYLSSGSDLPEAKQRLIHRYELNTKRAREQTRDDLYALFLDAFATALDPHTNYLSADTLEDFQIQMQLSLEGIGVALSERDGYSVVEQIIAGGAADRLDVLRPRDKIIAVGDDGQEPIDVIDMQLRDVVRLIRGKKGTRVNLTVLRKSDTTERFQVAIVRDTIDLESAAAKLRAETVQSGDRELRLGVLELPSFYGDSDPAKRQGSRDVAKLLREAREQKLDGLVLDLSRNGGGLLEDAVRISGFFVREGGMVAIRGDGEAPRVLQDPDDGVLWNGPLVVLTSRVSASASEILAGALKDYRRALIVGDDHTFGKGTVQSVFPLRRGQGALKVTTALFYRPGGRSTQHTGVETDVQIPSFLNHDGFGELTLPYSLQAEPIERFAGSEANGGDAQERWTPLTKEIIAELARRSGERVRADKFFQEVETKLAERAQDDGVVTLAELLEEREEVAAQSEQAGPGDGAREEGGAGAPGTETASHPPPATGETEGSAEQELTPQAKEAIQILADLVLLTT